MRIFLSYRRSDAEDAAGRLADRLRKRFGRNNVFVDVVTIRPGLEWRRAIEQAVAECDVMLVVIGPDWLDAVDEDGARRIDIADDTVRSEIVAGLDRGIPVVPVVVRGARVPRAGQLPEALAGLAGRQAERLDHQTFDSDVTRLVASLAQFAGRSRGMMAVGALGVAVAVSIVVAIALRPQGGGPPDATTAPSVTTTSTVASAAPCPFEADGDSVVQPQVTPAGRASGLVFCPIRINGGTLPITGPFELAGQVIGEPDTRRNVLLWNQSKVGTCDAEGRPVPVADAKFVVSKADLGSADGAWRYTDQLGYEEAVTYARQFEFVTADAADLQAIVDYRDAWAKRPGNNPNDVPVLRRENSRLIRCWRPSRYRRASIREPSPAQRDYSTAGCRRFGERPYCPGGVLR